MGSLFSLSMQARVVSPLRGHHRMKYSWSVLSVFSHQGFAPGSFCCCHQPALGESRNSKSAFVSTPPITAS